MIKKEIKTRKEAFAVAGLVLMLLLAFGLKFFPDHKDGIIFGFHATSFAMFFEAMYIRHLERKGRKKK